MSLGFDPARKVAFSPSSLATAVNQAIGNLLISAIESKMPDLVGGTIPVSLNVVCPPPGTDGQIAYNNNGAFGGLSLGSGLSIVSGVLTLTGGGSGTVTSVGLSAPTGFSVTGSPVTGSGTLTFSFAAGYSLPTTASQANWNTAYSERLQWDGGSTGLNATTARTSLGLGSLATQSGTFSGTSSGTNTGDQDLSGYATSSSVTASLAGKADLDSGGKVPAAQLPSFVTDSVTEGTVNLYYTATRALAAALTGFTAGAGTVTASDSILQAFQKVVGNIANRATTGAIGSSGLTMTTNRLLGRSTASTGAPEEFTPLGLAFNGTNLATLADLVIPLSDETTALTASSTVAKVTIPYWPRATVLTDLPIWAVATAPTGAALQFDIQVGGTSIYLPASGGTYPTIEAGSTNSTASAGTFTTAFAAAPTIAAGSSVTFFVRQIGSTVAGAGLKVALLTRRAG